MARAGHLELLRSSRDGHVRLLVEGHNVFLRDQAPLHPNNIAFTGGWNFGDLLEAVNGLVFFGREGLMVRLITGSGTTTVYRE